MTIDDTATEIRHATAIALAGRGLVIAGPSGAGKSGLALQLMAFGAELVADDRTRFFRAPEGPLMAVAPAGLPAAIEARGVGLLRARLAGPAPVAALVDLGRRETARLPEPKTVTILGCEVPLLHNPETTYFAAALSQYLRFGKDMSS